MFVTLHPSWHVHNLLLIKMYNHNQSSSDQNNNNKSTTPPMSSPRISFSNDFVETSHHSNNSHNSLLRNNNAYRDAPVSSDFEFSTSNYSMMSADELFFKGRLLPLKESCSTNTSQKTTLRDELQNGTTEDDTNNNKNGGGFSLRPPKNPTRWRGFLGLRKSHIGSSSKKSERNVCHDGVQCSKNSQDFVD